MNLKSLLRTTYALDGQQNSLLKVEKRLWRPSWFSNEAKNIPRQDFMVMNISCIYEKSTYNILASRWVLRKSLYTAAVAVYSGVIHSIHWMLSSGYNYNSSTLAFNIHHIHDMCIRRGILFQNPANQFDFCERCNH